MHTGCDISTWQTTLDYEAMKAGGIEFAYIRMTEGTSIKDGQAPTHVAGCIKAGILWGGYHFFLPGTPSATQAVYFMGMLTHFPAPQLPPMIDVETSDPLGWAHLASVSVDCLRMIEEDANSTGGIYYCNESFARSLPGFPFTRTTGIDLAAPTSTPAGIPHVIRQLAPQQVPGAPNPIDVDEFIGTEAQWESFSGTPKQGDPTVPLPTDVVASWAVPETNGTAWLDLHADGGLFAYGGATDKALTYIAVTNEGNGGGRYHFGPKGDKTAFSYPGLPAADQNVAFPTRRFVAMTVLAYRGKAVK